MGNLNVEEIMGSLSGEELCKYCRYGIDYDCNGGVRSDGVGNPIYPPCADGLDEDYFDLDAYLADEGVPENCEECKEFDSEELRCKALGYYVASNSGVPCWEWNKERHEDCPLNLEN